MKSLAELNISNKNLVIRVDMNVPISNGAITDLTRIEACLPSIKHALDNNCKILLVSHLGRPTEGKAEEAFSLAPVSEALSNILNEPVQLVDSYASNKIFNSNERVQLLENVRFFNGEMSNDDLLGKALGGLGDIYVFDAFGTAHRKQASTHSAILSSKESCSGILLKREIDSLNRAMLNAPSPYLAIIGGAKVSSKLGLIKNLNMKADNIIVGGGIANTFLKASGYEIGTSLVEDSMLDVAAKMLKVGKILLPSTVVTSTSFQGSNVKIKQIDDVTSEEMILDQMLTPNMKDAIKRSRLILWNGPLGVFENSLFSSGTESLAKNIKESNGYSIAGGGETLSAINTFINKDDVSYCSTGGGAFLEFMEGKELPSIEALGREKLDKEKK
ncbi:phosphoglycerate kinase [Gammaproteobacteria bacterium]|nr:phosphoglycerate kinase [Gammaproteobacteria bacterium]